MSTTTAALRLPARPAPAPEEAPRRHVEIVPSRDQRRARPRVAHALMAVAGVFAIIGAQLGLSIALSAGAYQIGDLQDRQRELQRVEESLDELLQVYSSTQHLATNATALGMVPGGSQYYLDLVSGAAVAAPGMPNPFGCGSGCTLVPNALSTALPLATAGAGAKVIGRAPAAAPATGVAVPVVVGDPAATPVEGEAAAPVADPVPSDAPPASGSIPGPVTR